MYYELATMTLPFGTAAQASQNVHAFCTAPEARGELLGCWFTDIGVLNQMIVLRGFDTLDALRAEGKDATFEAVRELAGGDMADATIRTQRQRWREFNGIKREEKKPARKSGKPTVAKQSAPAVVSEEVQQQSA